MLSSSLCLCRAGVDVGVEKFRGWVRSWVFMSLSKAGKGVGHVINLYDTTFI